MVADTIYCNSYHACEGAELGDIGNSVIGSGYRALAGVSITNVSNNVVGTGYQVIQGSMIRNVVNIYCSGEESCNNANINNFRLLKAFGTNSLSGTTLVANNSTSNVTIE